MRRFLCLFFPRWSLQCLQQACPETRGAAVGLFERTAHGPRITECSEQANTRGVWPEMSVADAQALTSELMLYEADFSADGMDLEALGLWMTQFSPLVAVERADEHLRHPQSLLLETTGCEDVFGGERSLVKHALRALRKRGFNVRAAMSATPGAAWAIAHYGKAGSLTGNEPDAARTALEPLPLAALRLNTEMLEDLRRLGLDCIGALLRQPRASLPSRFGPLLLKRMDQALGLVPEPIPLLRAPPEFREAVAFEYPIRSGEMLFNVLEKKIVKLSEALQRAARGARQIECWLYHEIAAPTFVKVALHRGSARRKHLWQLLRTRLEEFFRTPHTRLKTKRQNWTESISVEAEECVCAVALHVTSTDPLAAGQLALFESKTEEQNGDLALLLDRLVTRLGTSAVCRVCLVDDPAPERAYRIETLEQYAAETWDIPFEAPAMERPLCLLPAVQSIECDLPHKLTLQGKVYTLRGVHGPERIESGWWRNEYIRRDYYIAETECGSRYWIFRQLHDQRWFLHGIF